MHACLRRVAAVTAVHRRSVSTVTTSQRSSDSDATSTQTSSSSSSSNDDGLGSKLSPFRPFDATREVRSEQILSARDVAQMLPSSRALRAQLPSARELEAKYMRGSSAAAKASSSSSSDEKVVDDDSRDAASRSTPIEDVLFGEDMTSSTAARQHDGNSDGDNDTRARAGVQLHHVLLAYRALWWGTVYAFVGVGAVVCVALVLCGCYSVADVQLLLARTRMQQQQPQQPSSSSSRNRDEADEDRPGEAHYTIDLTNGSAAAWQQVVEVWRAVQATAEAEAAAAEAAEAKPASRV